MPPKQSRGSGRRRGVGQGLRVQPDPSIDPQLLVRT